MKAMKATPADCNRWKTKFHSSKAKQILKKNRRILREKTKNCERNMQELCDYIKRPNLQKLWASKKEKRCKPMV
jgi:hypothetical protein